MSKEIDDLRKIILNQNEAISQLRSQLESQKKQHAELDNAVYMLQEEKTNLRKAVHKLKLRHTMMSRKVNKLKEIVRERFDGDDETTDDEFDLIDYDDIGRNFNVIGGRSDPLAFGYSQKFKDEEGLEHASAERYYWYLMAEHFHDTKAMSDIQQADTYIVAENAKKAITNFDERQWSKVKLEKYRKATEQKYKEVRAIANLLVLTDNTYLAVAQDDKFFGTGWRKQREESMKPLTWDGENNGGRVLMNVRKMLMKTHSWNSEEEKAEAENRYRDLKRYTWRRVLTSTKSQRSNYTKA